MSALSVQPTFPIFTDIDGQPLEDGYIWIGVANLAPIVNPINVYWDAALTQLAVQPIRTLAGYPANSGTPARLYVGSDYSIQVQNKNGSVIYSSPTATERYSDVVVSGIDSSEVSFLQAGSGAVTRTAQAKMRDVINVKDFGAVADGSFVAGGSASGTDNLAAFNAALAAAASTGISHVYVPGGRYYISGRLELPGGVILQGDGTAWLPGFLANTSEGTALLINGAAASDCFAFQENSAHAEVRDMSIYNTNTNAIRAVVSVVGHLYPRMKNVELASLRKTTGSGLFLVPATTGPQYETLWGDFDNVVATITDIGSATEASFRWGLTIYAFLSNKSILANTFKGGQFAGTWGGLYCDGNVAGARPTSNVFLGTKFDTVWDGTFTPTFRNAASKVYGFTKADCYIYPVVLIGRGDGIAFQGCYFEVAGAPATYNDGVNGTATLLGVLWVNSPTDSVRTGASNCSWLNTYVYDDGLQSNISPVTNGFKHDNHIPASLLLRQATAQSIPNAAFTKVQFSTILQGDDSNLEWDAVNYVVKIRQPGVYQIGGIITFAGWSTANTYAICRITGGGFNIVGNYAGPIGAGSPISSAVNCALSLVIGDTIEIQVLQNQGTSQALSANESILSVVKIA